MLIYQVTKEKSLFFGKEKNEGLGELDNALFFLFTLFRYFFCSFRHFNNLKATIKFNLYLKFANRLIYCLNLQKDAEITAIIKISLKKVT